MKKENVNSMLLALLVLAVVAHLLASLATPASAFDAKVGSDSAAVSVAASADGMHVYICDAKRCYASHDGGKLFAHMKVD